MRAHVHIDIMETKKILLLIRGELARILGHDIRSARLNAFKPVAFLKKGVEMTPLFDGGDVPIDAASDYAALQETHGMDRVNLARKLEVKHGRDWQKPFKKQLNTAGGTK